MRKQSRFSTTRWSLILAAGQKPTLQTRKALSALCELYWYPLYAFARRRGHEVEEARDLTQSFFTRLLEKNDLASTTPSRGRFRTWLLAAFKHFLANDWDRTQAKKRGGGARELSIDSASAEGRYRIEPPDNLTPEKLFARKWAHALLDTVLAALRADWADKGKSRLFEALKGALDGEVVQSRELAVELEMTPENVRQNLNRLRIRHGELLRAEVAQTLVRPEDLDDELRALFAALGDGL